MGQIQLRSFGAKLYAAFAVIAVLILLLTGFVFYSFKQFSQLVYQTAGDMNVTDELVAALYLSENSARLLATAPGLAAADDRASYETIRKQLKLLLDQTEKNLSDLEAHAENTDKAIFSRIRASHRALESSLGVLTEQSGKKIALAQQRAQYLTQLQKLHGNLMDTIEPAVYGISSWAKMSARRTARRNSARGRQVTQRHLNRLTCLCQLRSAASGWLPVFAELPPEARERAKQDYSKSLLPALDAVEAGYEKAESPDGPIAELLDFIRTEFTDASQSGWALKPGFLKERAERFSALIEAAIQAERDSLKSAYRELDTQSRNEILKMVEQSARDLTYTLEIKAHGNLMISLLNRVSETDSLSVLSDLKARFIKSNEAFQNAQQVFSTIELAKTNPVLNKTITEIAHQFKQMAGDEGGLFAIRKQELSIRDRLNELMAENRGIAKQLQANIEKMVQLSKAHVDRFQASLYQQIRSIKESVLVFNSLVILAILLFSFWIPRPIKRSLNLAVKGLNQSALQISSVSNQVFSASHQLAESASEQARAVEETSSYLQDISDRTQQNAQDAQGADSLFKETDGYIDQAGQAIDALIRSMSDITAASHDTYQIVKTIHEIAFQTKLLALNASVEAARAGEAGAGFAVVANEVKNLAVASSQAAEQTGAMIESTVEKVAQGSRIADTSHEAVKKVVARSDDVIQLLGRISESSRLQADEIEAITRRVAAIDRKTHQNARDAADFSSVSDQMNTQSKRMEAVVSDLGVLIGRQGANGKPKKTALLPKKNKKGDT